MSARSTGDEDLRYPPIGDYGILGDCGSAALVSRTGSIDWLCWPSFDSPSLFAAILDADRGGRFRIRPTQPFEVERRYVECTNVLETTFVTETGRLRLVDLMVASDKEDIDASLRPDHELLRVVEGVAGQVELEVLLEPRLAYGREAARFEARGALGFFCQDGGLVLVVRSELELTPEADGARLTDRVVVRAGERYRVSLCADIDEPAILPTLGHHADRRVEETIDYWQRWSARCDYDGPYRAPLLRAALTLKLMCFSRSGAIVAAPTTSLPEALGGERNWDYRFCWLRDATLTLRVLFELGYEDEAYAFFSWLVYAVGGAQPRLQVLYDLFGGNHAEERQLDHLEGYRGSKPVRVGNAAEGQLQLDVYGEVLSVAYEFVKHGGQLTRAQGRLLRQVGETICDCWEQPDDGIWESRGPRQHYTHSKAMCCVGLERLIELSEKSHLDVDEAHLRAVCDRIREAVETRGFNEALNAYTRTFDGDEMDASLLLLSTYGYVEADDPRMVGTFERVTRELERDGLMMRYRSTVDDGLSGEEAAFGICSFWDEQQYARMGRVEEARARFEKTMTYANDLGLFAEEIDPVTGAALGNFPQAFTHVGLINAVLAIAEAEGRHEAEPEEIEPGETEGEKARHLDTGS